MHITRSVTIDIKLFSLFVLSQILSRSVISNGRKLNIDGKETWRMYFYVEILK